MVFSATVGVVMRLLYVTIHQFQYRSTSTNSAVWPVPYACVRGAHGCTWLLIAHGYGVGTCASVLKLVLYVRLDYVNALGAVACA